MKASTNGQELFPHNWFLSFHTCWGVRLLLLTASRVLSSGPSQHPFPIPITFINPPSYACTLIQQKIVKTVLPRIPFGCVVLASCFTISLWQEQGNSMLSSALAVVEESHGFKMSALAAVELRQEANDEARREKEKACATDRTKHTKLRERAAAELRQEANAEARREKDKASAEDKTQHKNKVNRDKTESRKRAVEQRQRVWNQCKDCNHTGWFGVLVIARSDLISVMQTCSNFMF
jgi:hypothetical protein